MARYFPHMVNTSTKGKVSDLAGSLHRLALLVPGILSPAEPLAVGSGGLWSLDRRRTPLQIGEEA